MHKELKDITEEDIKDAAREAGFVVSWMNAKYPLGMYAFMWKYYNDQSAKELTDHYERTAYEVGTGSYTDLQDFIDVCKQDLVGAPNPVVFKYHEHYISDGKLYIRFAALDRDREQTADQIRESLISPLCHRNVRDVLFYYDL